MTATFADLPAIEAVENVSAWDWIKTHHDASVALGMKPAFKDAQDAAIKAGSDLTPNSINERGRVGHFVFTAATPRDAAKMQEVPYKVTRVLMPEMNPHQVANAIRTGTTTQPAAYALVALNKGDGRTPVLPEEMVKNFQNALEGVSVGIAQYRAGEWTDADISTPLWWTLVSSLSIELAEWNSERIGDAAEAELNPR